MKIVGGMTHAARAEHPRHQLRERRQRHVCFGIVIAAGGAGIQQRIEVVALDAGAVVASGSVSEVAADPRVRAAYLGRREL